MAKNKYYTVWRGRKTGVFDSWDECKAQITGFEGAQYKGYPTREEATAAHAMEYWKAIKAQPKEKIINSEQKPIYPSLAVDAACSGNPGKMEYRGVDCATGREIFHLGPFENGTNNIGEFLALVHGLALMKQNNSTAPIYSDSITAMAWVRAKKCKSRLPRTESNVPLFNLIYRAELWLQNNTYTTPIYKWETEIWGEIPADFGRK